MPWTRSLKRKCLENGGFATAHDNHLLYGCLFTISKGARVQDLAFEILGSSSHGHMRRPPVHSSGHNQEVKGLCLARLISRHIVYLPASISGFGRVCLGHKGLESDLVTQPKALLYSTILLQDLLERSSFPKMVHCRPISPK